MRACVICIAAAVVALSVWGATSAGALTSGPIGLRAVMSALDPIEPVLAAAPGMRIGTAMD